MSRSAEFNNQVSLLGLTGRVPLRGTQFRPSQTSDLYSAERIWREYHSNVAHKTTDNPGDFVGEIVHHSAMDELPGIEELRKTWTPNRVWVYDHRTDGPTGSVDDTGIMRLRKDKLNIGTLTHETSHLLGVHGQQFKGVLSRSDNPREYQLATGYGHEWPFAATHLHVVNHTISPAEARELRGSYRSMGVRYRPRGVPGHKGFE
jgi:hypothetical protein